MRIRALLFIPALAAAALAIGVSSASAATLFTTTSHTARVTVGATAVATSTRPVDLTVGGTLANRCAHSALNLTLVENTTTRVALDVTAGSFSTCAPNSVTGTFSWRATITGNSTTIGTEKVWSSTIHNLGFDLANVGKFDGNLENGVTATQTTTGPVCLVAVNASGVTGPVVGTFDATYCLTGAVPAAWRLT